MTAKRNVTPMKARRNNDLTPIRAALARHRRINVDALSDEQVRSLWSSLPARTREQYLTPPTPEPTPEPTKAGDDAKK